MAGSDASEHRHLCVRVTGRVQGVGFRMHVQRAAQREQLAGWVRNEADGSVAAEVAGPGAAVARWLRTVRAGPPYADVRDVAVSDATGDEPMGGFTIRS